MRDYDEYDRQEVREVFERITEHTVHHGGGTFQHKTGAVVDLQARYGSGYLVSVEEYGDTPLLPRVTLSDRIARLWPRHIGPHVQYVGTWVDGGKVYVDGSTVIPDLRIALALARKHGQRAIYNITTGESEYIDNAPGECEPVYAHGEPYCPHCGALLVEPGSTYLAVSYPPGAEESRCTTCSGRVELPDMVEFGEPGPNVVYWSDDRPYCPHCDTVLDTPGSVTYSETYPTAWIEEGSADTAVVYQPHDYTPVAHCAACGGELEIDDVIAD